LVTLLTESDPAAVDRFKPIYETERGIYEQAKCKIVLF
jgi:hypothetical protein